MNIRPLLPVLFLALLSGSGFSQIKRLDQDPTRNNLEHAEGAEVGEFGKLSQVEQFGNGPRNMILIAGMGFDGSIFEKMMLPLQDEYTMYTVTLPGFGGTAPPPMPTENKSYGDLAWIDNAVDCVERFIEENNLERPVIVTHWLVASHVGLRLAARSPDKCSRLVIISGMAKFMAVGGGNSLTFENAEQRTRWVDEGMAAQWFKTVTRDTWDDNNFYPHDYAKHPVRGLQLWRIARQATLATNIRYYCEMLTQDANDYLPGLKTPTLILQPGFDGDLFFEGDQNYMNAFLCESWETEQNRNPLVQFRTIADSRAFLMDDQPDALQETLTPFLTEDSGSP